MRRANHLVGMVEIPGSHDFKVMVVTDQWKYIFMANGGREQLFNRKKDPNELVELRQFVFPNQR